jgi:hypothetical protein
VKGQPQLPNVPAVGLTADVLQAVKALQQALLARRRADRQHAEEEASQWKRDATLDALRRACLRATRHTVEARANLDAVLLGDEP